MSNLVSRTLARASHISALAFLPNLRLTPSCFRRMQRGLRPIFFLFLSNAGQYQDRTQQLMEVIKGMEPLDGWPDPLGYVAVSLGVCPGGVPLPDLQNPEIRLDFFAEIPDFAVCPDLSRHPPAAAAGISGKKRA